MPLQVSSLSSWLQQQLPSISPALCKLGVASAGLGLAYLALKEVRLALRSMPDEDSPSHGGEIVAKVLQAHGVKHIFTLIGGHISPILVASKKLGITVIDFRHEVNCVFAADAMSRLTGITGVAAVTAGPGVTNTITAVKNAQMAQSPLVLLGGAAPTILKVSALVPARPPPHAVLCSGSRVSSRRGPAVYPPVPVQVQRVRQQRGRPGPHSPCSISSCPLRSSRPSVRGDTH
jgi:hypothetical protein